MVVFLDQMIYCKFAIQCRKNMGFVSVENEISDERAVKVARHVTWVGFWVNAVLGAGKVLAGVFGRL